MSSVKWTAIKTHHIGFRMSFQMVTHMIWTNDHETAREDWLRDLWSYILWATMHCARPVDFLILTTQNKHGYNKKEYLFIRGHIYRGDILTSVLIKLNSFAEF